MLGGGGLSMMLKSMGFDPEDFAKQIGMMRAAAAQTVQHFDQRLMALEAGQERILAALAESQKGASDANRQQSSYAGDGGLSPTAQLGPVTEHHVCGGQASAAD